MSKMQKEPDFMEKIVSLCKRRGFVYQASEIYGGLNSCWDYGPLGVELKRRVKEAWWDSLVYSREDIVGLDSSILQSPRVWEASGHVQGFTDPLVDCKSCKQRFRADHLPANTRQCPNCGGELTQARQFNLMFKTFMGPVEDSAAGVFLRPETAQGIFINFPNVMMSTRKKLPFGIAQIGKSFRNEITPGNFVFRTREFEQMEMEFFIKEQEAEQWYAYWKKERLAWYVAYGIRAAKLRLREHEKEELAHYAAACADVEYEFPFGWSELEGIANRTDFDLKQHQKFSGKDMSYFDEETKARLFPYVIEPAAGVDRTALTFLVDAYDEVEVKGEKRVVLHFHPQIAPITVGIFPLVNKEGMPEKAREIEQELRKLFPTSIEVKQSIGRRYARQDEVGTPYCVTVDGQSMQDDTVTLRDRDTMEQERVKVAELGKRIEYCIGEWKRL